MSFTELVIRLAVAALCGAAIGFEREHQRKPAGLRTHMLVAIGSAAFTLAALSMDHLEGLGVEGPRVHMDPSRVIQGIAGGIGFLGAGAILRSNGSVYGLTTAATIWVSGAVGICCGLGNYLLAVTTSVLVVLIAGILGMVEGWLFSEESDSPNAKPKQGLVDDTSTPSTGRKTEESPDS